MIARDMHFQTNWGCKVDVDSHKEDILLPWLTATFFKCFLFITFFFFQTRYTNRVSKEDLTEPVSSPITTPKNTDGMWLPSRSWSREAFLIITSFFTRRVCHSPEPCLDVGWGEETWGKCQIKQLRSHDSPGGLHLPLGPWSGQRRRAGTLTLELCSLRSETVSDTPVWNSLVVCKLQRMSGPEVSLYM